MIANNKKFIFTDPKKNTNYVTILTGFSANKKTTMKNTPWLIDRLLNQAI
jgi:hypothetical protein